MGELIIGGFAMSVAGHDAGQCYVIVQTEKDYAYLVDGRIRTLDHSKKKKVKHITMLEQSDPVLAEKIIKKTAKNEEIKRAIKLLKQMKQ